MTIADLKMQIKQRQLDSLYIFTGPEYEVQKLYLAQMARCKFDGLKRVDDVPDVLALLKRGSGLFADTAERIIVVRVNTSEELEMVIKIPAEMYKNNTVVVLADSIDKRTKVYKECSEHIVLFDYLPESVLIDRIRKQCNLSVDNCRRLIEICEQDYGRILLELDKLKNFFEKVEKSA